MSTESLSITSGSIRSSSSRFTSFGRGGIGNIHQSGLEASVTPNPPEFHVSGRELIKKIAAKSFTGRGGAGNVLAPSTKTSSTDLQKEQALIQKSTEADATRPRSFGRGGMGNIKTRP